VLGCVRQEGDVAGALQGDRELALVAGARAHLANHLESTIKEYEKIRQEQEAAQAGNQIRTSDKDVMSDTGSFL
jgi:hypothetical protein